MSSISFVPVLRYITSPEHPLSFPSQIQSSSHTRYAAHFLRSPILLAPNSIATTSNVLLPKCVHKPSSSAASATATFPNVQLKHAATGSQDPARLKSAVITRPRTRRVFAAAVMTARRGLKALDAETAEEEVAMEVRLRLLRV